MGVATHEHQGKPLEEMADDFFLFLALVSSKGGSQLLYLFHGYAMKATLGVSCHRDKVDSLCPAGFSCNVSYCYQRMNKESC